MLTVVKSCCSLPTQQINREECQIKPNQYCLCLALAKLSRSDWRHCIYSHIRCITQSLLISSSEHVRTCHSLAIIRLFYTLSAFCFLINMHAEGWDISGWLISKYNISVWFVQHCSKKRQFWLPANTSPHTKKNNFYSQQYIGVLICIHCKHTHSSIKQVKQYTRKSERDKS